LTKEDNIISGPWEELEEEMPDNLVPVTLASKFVTYAYWLGIIMGFLIGFKWGAGL